MGQFVGQALRLETVSILLALLALGALYLLALDQGYLLSLVQGSVAFDQNLIHEAVHDARHAAGFPCH
jgi:cobalt transporter subunit CbtB